MQDALVDTVSVHTAMYSVHTVTVRMVKYSVRMVRCSAHTATVRMVRCSAHTATVRMARCSVHTATVRMMKCSVHMSTVRMVRCSAHTVTVRMVRCSVRTAIDYIDYSTVVPGQSAVNFPPALELTAVNTLTSPVSVAVNSPTEQLLHNADKKPLFHHTVCRKMYIA